MALELGLGRVELVDGRGDVAHGDGGVLAGHLGVHLAAPEQHCGGGAPRTGPVVHVGPERLEPDHRHLGRDLLLVLADLLTDLGDGLAVGGHPGRDHPVLLLVRVDLQLLLDQALGDGGSLGPERRHLIGSGRSGGGDHQQGGRREERGEEHCRDLASTVHSGGQIRHRWEPGAKHNGRPI